MADGDTSLAERFAALQTERARTWSEAQRTANLAQRGRLLADFDPARAVQPGDRLPDATLLDSRGAALTLGGIVAEGPAVLILFRFATCPADDLALPHYDRVLRDAGVPVIAISPQRPDRLDAIRARHDLALTVASDPDNALARALGLTFTPIDTPDPPPAGWIGEVTGTGTWELPLTSVLVIDRQRVARFVAISPDWLDRIEAPAILAAFDRARVPIPEPETAR